MEILQILAAMNWAGVLAAFWIVVGSLATLLSALIAFFMLIPGEQPEKFFKGILDFITKYSKK